MDHREIRNEFGLDEYNASDVRKERVRPYASWLLGLIAIVAVLAVAIYLKSNKTSENASSAPATTGAGATIPQQAR